MTVATTIQAGAKRLSLCAILMGGAAPAADTASVRELPFPEGLIGNLGKVAADGTVYGSMFGEGVARWRPGEAAELLGGGVAGDPHVSADGSILAASCSMPNPDDPALTLPTACLWGGGTTWLPIGGTLLRSSQLQGMSRAGTFLVGFGHYAAAPDELERHQPWVWSAARGQRVLPQLLEEPSMPNAVAAAVSNDGSVVVGHIEQDWPDVYLRHAVIWDAAGVRRMRDVDGNPVGYATACNSDCTVVVGSGHFSGGGSPQAWRWTAQTGVQYLGAVPGSDPAMPSAAFAVSDDGSLIVGSYSFVHPEGFQEVRPFVWTPHDGMVDVTDYLATFGVEYGSDRVGWFTGMSPDGRHLALRATTTDWNNTPALVTIHRDRIRADGFESP